MCIKSNSQILSIFIKNFCSYWAVAQPPRSKYAHAFYREIYQIYFVLPCDIKNAEHSQAHAQRLFTDSKYQFYIKKRFNYLHFNIYFQSFSATECKQNLLRIRKICNIARISKKTQLKNFRIYIYISSFIYA